MTTLNQCCKMFYLVIKCVEGNFGIFDLLMRTRPNASCQSMVSVGDVVLKRLCLLSGLNVDKNQKMMKKRHEKRMKKTGNL